MILSLPHMATYIGKLTTTVMHNYKPNGKLCKMSSIHVKRPGKNTHSYQCYRQKQLRNQACTGLSLKGCIYIAFINHSSIGI